MSDTFFTRARAANKPSGKPRRPPPIIDQDGNELPGGGFFGGGFKNAGGFKSAGGFSGAGFEGVFGGIAFGKHLTREQRFARLNAIAQLLDIAFVVPGTKVRYGIDGLIGLVPVVGDLLAGALQLWVVREARQLGAPAHVIARMLGNVAINGVIGIVPFAGDAFDVMFRANMRNMKILRRWMDKQQRKT